MEVVIAWPPNIERIKKVFNLEGKKPLFCYGKIIFAPYGEINDPLRYHEATHSIQQDIGVEKWWNKYLYDKEFRLSQEIPAYQNQYVRMCELVKDRNQRFRYLTQIASDMSSEMYGNMISYSEALKVIQNK